MNVNQDFRRVTALFVTGFVFVVSALGAEVMPRDGFCKFVEFTTAGYDGGSLLVDFPVLVRLREGSPAGFSYSDCAALGSDLRFTDASGVQIPHEVDFWNPAGESLVWVKLPELSGAGTKFRMYFSARPGRQLPLALESSSTWTDGGYRLVYHNNVNAEESHSESTGSGLVGRRSDQKTVTIAEDKMGAAPLGPACYCTPGGWSVPNDAHWSDCGTSFSVSVWARMTSSSSNYNRVLYGVERDSVAAQYKLLVSEATGNNTSVVVGGDEPISGVALPDSIKEWSLVTLVFDGTNVALYQNGKLVTTKPAAVGGNVTDFNCGYRHATDGEQFWYGYVDELRLRRGAESADWVKAEYDTVSNAEFLAATGVVDFSGLWVFVQ